MKIAGQRAYALARQGKEVLITPRPVDIYEMAIEAYEYPQLELTIRCGSGTYVRSLGRDLAQSLGTCAVMSELVRTRIGVFDVAHSLSILDLNLEQIQRHLQAPATAVGHLPSLGLNAAEIAELRFGRMIAAPPSWSHTTCAAHDEQGNLVAMLTESSPGLLKPHINFAPIGMTVIFTSELTTVFGLKCLLISHLQSPTVNNWRIILPVVLATTRLQVLLTGKALAQAPGKLNTGHVASRR